MQKSLLKRKYKGVWKRRQKESFPDSCAWSRSLMTKASSPQEWTKWLSAVSTKFISNHKSESVITQVTQQSHKWVSDYTSVLVITQVDSVSGDGSRNVEWEDSCDWALRALKMDHTM